MDSVRLGQEELVRQFGVSRRLAARVGALLGRGVSVSPALLEIAGPGSAVERLLLLPALLDKAPSLDSADLNALAKEARAERDGPFVVAHAEAGPVLALEEELLAEKALKRGPPAEPTALVRPEEAFAPARLLDERETRRLFSPEEVARLKLEALAGRSAEDRASALRKLVFAPLDPHEKGGIFLRALMDGAAGVRSEAIRAIESLGFDRDTADAMQGLFAGDERARGAALRRIGDLLGKLRASERRIVLAVLVEALREARPSRPDDPLVRLLLQSAPLFAEHPELAPETARVCIAHLLAGPALGPVMRDLLLALVRAFPEAVLERLWTEAQTVTAAAPRALLLGLLIETETRPDCLPRLADLAAGELTRLELDELSRRKLGHNMAALGRAAAEALLRRFNAASTSERAALVPFLDALAMEQTASPRDRERIARALLDAIKAGDARLRLAVMGTRALAQSDLPVTFRRELAAELLPLLRAREFPEMAAQAAALLENMGQAVAEGMFAAIAEHPGAAESDIAARALGRMLHGAPKGGPAAKLLPRVIELFGKRVAMPANSLGGYAEALGWIATAPALATKESAEILDLLLQHFGRTRCQGEVAEAIGRIAGSGKAGAQRVVRVTQLFADVLEQSGGREKAPFRAKETPKGKVYQIAGRVEFDSETVPAAVSGLESILLSEATPEDLRARMTERLLRTWDEVAAWRMVWGPRAAERLAYALGRIGADAQCGEEIRSRIITALAAAPERISAVRALNCVFSGPMASEKTGAAAVSAALKVLDHWIEPEIAPEELRAVLTAAATAAANAPAPPRSSDARRLRTRTTELLLDAFRTGKEWARPELEKLRDAPALPGKLRDEIAERLSRGARIVDG